MESREPQQVFVRNELGTVWGPITLPSVELLFDGGVLKGKVEVSLDGIHFGLPGLYPTVRRVFPRALWGDVVVPGEEAGPPPMASPPRMPPAPPAPGVAGAPIAGPGAMANAQAAPRGAAPQAGPGARAAAEVRRPARPAQSPPHPAPPPPSAARAEPPPPPSQPPSRPEPFKVPAPTTEPLEIPPPSGSLTDFSPLRLYYLAAAGDVTALLTLVLADRQIEIHFRKGNPEYIASSHPEDSLETFLVRNALLTADQYRQADAAKERFGGEVLAALFGTGLLNPGSAFAQLAQRATLLLGKALAADRGTFTFAPKDLSPSRAMPLGNRWALLIEQVRRIPTLSLRQRMAAAMDLPVMKSGGRVPVNELRLNAQESRVLPHIDGVRSLSQLIADYPAEADAFVRVVYLLKELDAASFASVPVRPEPSRPVEPPPPVAPGPPAADATAPFPGHGSVAPASPAPGRATTSGAASAPTPGHAPSPAPPRAPGPPVVTASAPPAGPTAPPTAGAQVPPGRPAPAPASPRAAAPSAPQRRPTAPSAAPATPAVDPAALQAELTLLRDLAAKAASQTHFELLGVSDKADANAVKIAYFKLAKSYHPDTVPAGAPPEMAQLKSDLFAQIGQAYRTLSDPDERARYLDHLSSGGAEVDVAKILAAEEMFQRATLLVKGRKYAEAIKLLDEAIDANSEEGEFYAWRGYATFFTVPDKGTRLTAALKDLNVCLKKNERCAQAYYFLGHMARLDEDLQNARKHFKKCVELQPGHIDAQRELRLLK